MSRLNEEIERILLDDGAIIKHIFSNQVMTERAKYKNSEYIQWILKQIRQHSLDLIERTLSLQQLIIVYDGELDSLVIQDAHHSVRHSQRI